MLQCVAPHCSVVQRVAACCSVLQHVAVKQDTSVAAVAENDDAAG